VFAVTQIGASFVLIAGAVMLLRRFALQAASAGFDSTRILAVNVPITHGPDAAANPGVLPSVAGSHWTAGRSRSVAIGSNVPWRDGGQTERAGTRFRAEGEQRGANNEDPRAKLRSVSRDTSRRSGAAQSGSRFHE
jgi:hypothetical protein